MTQPRPVRGAMGEEQVSSSDLSRTFGGAVSYWTRRVTGQLPFNDRDLELIAWATGRHPAEFMGGQAPAGWTAPARPFPGGMNPAEYQDDTPATGRYQDDWALAS